MALRGSLFSFACVLVLIGAASAAEPGKELLSAAKDGDLPRIRKLVGAGAGLESKDKKGKTPLILAAERGHVDAVKLLLERGANADARDKEGLTAFGRAVFSLEPPVRGSVLAALPRPPRLRVEISSAWLPEDMASSCFLSREELARLIGGIHPDALVLREFGEYARTAGLELLEIVTAEAAGMEQQKRTPKSDSIVDAGIVFDVRPGASCVRNADNLTLAIDVRAGRSGKGVFFEKTFGGGLRGLHAQSVNNASQYPPFFEKWARSHAGSIYWDLVKALLRTQ